MKKITFLFLLVFAMVQVNAQSIVIGTGTELTNGTGSDPVDNFYLSVKYQVVYTAAELSASLTPYDEITGLGFSVSEAPGSVVLAGYTIRMGNTSSTNSATHLTTATTTVKNTFDYTPTVTAEGAFDMIDLDTNFVWNGVDNIVIEICTAGPNSFTSPYGGVRATLLTAGSRSARSDGAAGACDLNTTGVIGNRPNIQFNYVDGTPPTDELDYYNLQFPLDGTIAVASNFTVYAQAYEAGLTDVTTGQAPGITAFIGYSAMDTDPSGTGWIWLPATFNVEDGNNDEYQLNLGRVILATGTFYYASRWSLNGAPYTYGGIKNDGSPGNTWDGTTYISGTLTITPGTNDLCSTATALTPGLDFAAGALPNGQTQLGLTGSGELPLPTCSTYNPTDPSGFGGDVWFSVVVPADGNLIIETNGNPTGSGGDTAMSVYTGTCGALVEFECDDDDSDDSLYSLVNISDITLANQTVYIRVFEYQGNNLLNFQISAYSATLSVNDFENANAFTYFPNPVKNELSLKAQTNIQDVAIYNMLGQEVLRTAPNTLESDINMNDLQTGAYFVKVTINDATETIRIIKQ